MVCRIVVRQYAWHLGNRLHLLIQSSERARVFYTRTTKEIASSVEKEIIRMKPLNDDIEPEDNEEQTLVQQASEWLEEQGELSDEQLQALAEEDTPEALERLRALAEKHDIPRDESMSAMDLVDHIKFAMEQEEE